MNVRLNPGSRPQARPPRTNRSVLVVSHERSGTHFLINAIANAYGYPPTQFLSLDPAQMLVNFHLPSNITATIAEAAVKRPDSLLKSHHPVEFFDGVLEELLQNTVVFYIHRHPVDVMISYWRYIHSVRWREGPKPDDVVAFAAAQPEGHMLRYQMVQQPSVLKRWAAHVDGWTAAAALRPRLVPVRYDSLDRDYVKTVSGFAHLFGAQPRNLERPARDFNVIAGPARQHLPEPDRDALQALCRTEVGDTMRRHRYD